MNLQFFQKKSQKHKHAVSPCSIWGMKTISQGEGERFNPLNDFLFLRTMGEKGDEEQLLGFLNAVLDQTGDNRFSSVEILENRSLIGELVKDKSCILDIRAVLQGGTRVNVEVQLLSEISDKSCNPSKYIILFIFYKAS